MIHAGGGITSIPPNIWQDNMLTGGTPFVIYPRVSSTSAAPLELRLPDHAIAVAAQLHHLRPGYVSAEIRPHRWRRTP